MPSKSSAVFNVRSVSLNLNCKVLKIPVLEAGVVWGCVTSSDELEN